MPEPADHVCEASAVAWTRLEEIVERFEEAWERGDRPAIDDYVPTDDGDGSGAVLIELIHTDLERRVKAGDGAVIEDYLQRYPELNRDPPAVLELIAAEYELRRRREPALEIENYVRRFPQYGVDLTARLQPVHGVETPTLARDVWPGSRSTSAPSGAEPEYSVHQRETLGPADSPRRDPHPPDIRVKRPAGTVTGLPSVPGYDILGVLGRGGMGVVYKARQTRLKRLVALKMILAGIHAGPEHLARFRMEAEAVARLQHPNIVQIHEIGEHQEGGGPPRPFMALEYVEGGSLAHIATPLPAQQAGRFVATLARAIHYAHERGIIHRDLKPANILLASVARCPLSVDEDRTAALLNDGLRTTDYGVPKITDFGLAKLLQSESASTYTPTGAVMGTPSYMAPEQAVSGHRDIGPAADVYSLGAILYELLTGRPPFKADTFLETLELARTQEPVPPAQVLGRRACPRDLETICLKCLQKDPRRRYTSARTLAEDLDRFLAGEPITARRVGKVERLGRWWQRNRTLTAVGTLAFTAVVAVAVLVFDRYLSTPESKPERPIPTKPAEDVIAAYRELAESNLREGLRYCEKGGKGDVSRGLLYLARSLEFAAKADDRDRRWVIQMNLAAWHRELNRQRDPPVLIDQVSKVSTVAFSRHGHVILTASGKSAWLWAAKTGERLRSFEHDDLVLAVAISPNAEVVATGSADKTARLWRASTGKPLGPPLVHQGTVRGIAFSPDGKSLLTGSGERTAQLWDVATGQPMGKALPHGDAVLCVAFSPSGHTLVTGSYDNNARLWDPVTGELIGKPLLHKDAVLAVALSPDERLLLTGGADKRAQLWDTVTGKALDLLHEDAVLAVAFSLPDGRLALTGSADRTARLWDVVTGKPIGPPLQHAEAVVAVAFTPQGNRFLTGSADRTVQLWTVPAPVEGDIERITLWVQVETGMELDASGIRELDEETRAARRKRLAEWGP